MNTTRYALVFAIGATLVSGSAFAPVPAIAQVGRMIPPSTVLTVSPAAEITSKKIEEGDKVQFNVVADVVEGGVVAIPRGTIVQGTITWKTGRAIGGKSGKFEVTFDHVTLNGRNYKLSGMHRQEGNGNSVGALLGSMVVTGRSAVMIPGQMANALTAEAIPF